MKRYFYQFLAVVVVIFLVNAWQSKDVATKVVAPQELGRLESIEKRFIPSASGSIQLVYFFAPWCSVCKYSIANVKYVKKIFSSLDVSFIGLDYDSTSEVKKFVTDENLGRDVFLGNDQTLARWGITAYPTYVILGKDGQIISSSVGYSTSLGVFLRVLYANMRSRV